MKFLDYHVAITRDEQTGQVVATIPALGIADYGPDLSGALTSLDEMLKFHLECLRKEGKRIPKERRTKEGFYLRVKLRAHAA
jgi:predicted RNase H-like HicB family nuclease